MRLERELESEKIVSEWFGHSSRKTRDCGSDSYPEIGAIDLYDLIVFLILMITKLMALIILIFTQNK